MNKISYEGSCLDHWGRRRRPGLHICDQFHFISFSGAKNKKTKEWRNKNDLLFRWWRNVRMLNSKKSNWQSSVEWRKKWNFLMIQSGIEIIYILVLQYNCIRVCYVQWNFNKRQHNQNEKRNENHFWWMKVN